MIKTRFCNISTGIVVGQTLPSSKTEVINAMLVYASLYRVYRTLSSRSAFNLYINTYIYVTVAPLPLIDTGEQLEQTEISSYLVGMLLTLRSVRRKRTIKGMMERHKRSLSINPREKNRNTKREETNLRM